MMTRQIVINPKAYEESIRSLIDQAIQGDKGAKDLLKSSCQQMDYNHLSIFLSYFKTHPNLDLNHNNNNSNIFDDLAGEMLDDILRTDEKEYPEIFKLLEQRFARSSWAQLILGYFHEIGIDNFLQRDIGKTKKYYQSSMVNCPRATAQLGNLYANGKISFDMKRAVEYWQEAAQKSDPLAQALLGALYVIGYKEILPKDEKLAIDYFKSSIKQNHHTGHALYARHLENKLASMLAMVDNIKTIKDTALKRIHEINHHYKIAANHYRSPLGCALFAKFLSSYNLPNSNSPIEDYYKLAIRHHEPKGFAFLAQHYMVNNQIEEGRNLIQQVETLTDPDVCGVLAAIYFIDSKNGEANKTKAASLAKIAASFENIEGLTVLGLINFATQEGRTYLARAASQNDTLALILCSKYISVVDENKQASLYYLKRATRNGSRASHVASWQISFSAYLYYSITNLFTPFHDLKFTSQKFSFEKASIYGERSTGHDLLTILGISRERAAQLLIDNAHDPVVRELCSLEILQAVSSGEFLRYLENSELNQNEQYASIKNALSRFQKFLVTEKNIQQELTAFCTNEEVLKVFADIYVRRVGSLIKSFDSYSIAGAIAYMDKIRFRVWEISDTQNKNSNVTNLNLATTIPQPTVCPYDSVNIFDLYHDNDGSFSLLSMLPKVQSQPNNVKIGEKSETTNLLTALGFSIYNFSADLFCLDKVDLDALKTKPNCNSATEISNTNSAKKESEEIEEKNKEMPLHSWVLTGTEDEEVTPWYVEEECRQEEERRQQKSILGKFCTIV